MSDCPNVEMREALPELLHGRLDAVLAAKVRAHAATCAECAAELELLERVKRAYAAAPAVDTAAIVRALPSPRTAGVRPARQASLGMLRIAAAVLLVLGGVWVMRMVTNGAAGGSDSTIVVQPVDSAGTTPVPDTPVMREPQSAAPRLLAMSLGELDDMEADELETLLGALDRIESAPVAEPDTLIGSVRGVGSD
jgi:anti-sigma factor RsiW